MEPQYENEEAREHARKEIEKNKATAAKVIEKNKLHDTQQKIKNLFNQVYNPNVEIPEPRFILIKKLAIMTEEFDFLRIVGQKVPDLPTSAGTIH